MKALRTIGIVLAILCVAMLGVGFVLQSQGGSAEAEAQASVGPTARVARGDIEETVSALGNVMTTEEANLVFVISGRIDEVLVEEGDEVEEAQVLARVDSSSLDRQIERAQVTLETAKARLAQVRTPATEAEMAVAQASIDAAKASLSKLLDGPTESDLQSAKLNVDSARNQLWGVQAQRDAVAGDRRQSNAQKDSSEAQVLVAEVAVEQALLAQERMKEPAAAEDVAITQSQIDQAEAQLAQLIDRPRAEDVAVSQAQVDEAALSLEQAKEQLEDTLLTAPFDGMVLSVAVNAGEWATPGMPAIVLSNIDNLVLDILLDEIDVAQIAVGQTVRLSFEALPKQEIVGTVTRIAPAATQTSGGVAYKVEVSFDAGELPIKLGMTANVDIVTDQATDALLVPNRAITADRTAGRYYVTRTDALGNTEKVEIGIGLRDDDYTQIVSGLDEGDSVVLQTMNLKDSDPAMQPMGPMGGMLRGGG